MKTHVRARGGAGNGHGRADPHTSLIAIVMKSYRGNIGFRGTVRVLPDSTTLGHLGGFDFQIQPFQPGVKPASKRSHNKGFRLAFLPREILALHQI